MGLCITSKLPYYISILSVSLSGVYYWCLNAINCTAKNMSNSLLYALGEADANMYLCSENIRPSKNQLLYHFTRLSCRNTRTVVIHNGTAVDL